MGRLNASALRLEWDADDRRQVEDAKDLYRRAKAEGRVVLDIEGNAVPSFHPNLGCLRIEAVELGETQFSIRFFDETGDRRLIWDSIDPLQVKEAAHKFNECIAKGWRGFAVDASGRKKRRVRSFNAATEEILFEEISDSEVMDNFAKTASSEISAKPRSEKMRDFVKSFKDIKVLPKTRPG